MDLQENQVSKENLVERAPLAWLVVLEKLALEAGLGVKVVEVILELWEQRGRLVNKEKEENRVLQVLLDHLGTLELRVIQVSQVLLESLELMERLVREVLLDHKEFRVSPDLQEYQV